MLVAFDDRGLQFKDVPRDDIDVLLHPIASREEAVRILAEAKKKRPDAQWAIVGLGPWGVRGES
jgi:hypothetical protein